MTRFILTRLGLVIPTFIGITFLAFFLIRLVPGDPIETMAGERGIDPVRHEILRKEYGFDRPVLVQYASYIGRLLQGDLGQSITSQQQVLPLILARLWISAQVVLVAVLLAALVAVPAGVIAAWRQNSLIDLAAVGTATLLLSVPTFWLGLLLLLLLGLHLQWLPVVGYVAIGEDPWRGLVYLVMPILTLFLHEIGVILRMARASTLEVLRLDYITHARAKGLSEAAVLWRHAFKNAFGPTWTLIGLVLGNLLGGIAVVETVFTIPGLGRLLVDSIFARDYPVIQGCLLFVAITYVLVNLVVDLCYPIFDPRVAVE